MKNKNISCSWRNRNPNLNQEPDRKRDLCKCKLCPPGQCWYDNADKSDSRNLPVLIKEKKETSCEEVSFFASRPVFSALCKGNKEEATTGGRYTPEPIAHNLHGRAAETENNRAPFPSLYIGSLASASFGFYNN